MASIKFDLSKMSESIKWEQKTLAWYNVMPQKNDENKICLDKCMVPIYILIVYSVPLTDQN